ncbi:MAG: FAD-binding oxidoreductase [Candidatus Saccharimonadales bacterium]
MSKIAHYLNEHILGDVTTDITARKSLANDASILTITPDIIVYPRVTNDIRKVTRFTHQLAEKGHVMSVSARGAGTDQTGAALTNGISINTPAYMNRIFEFDSKQRLVRLQPGVLFGELNQALRLQGYHVPGAPESEHYSTVGGAVANNASGPLSGRYGAMESSVEELEVVLANGDAIQTRRLSKRELNKKKGQQDFEGELYRAVDNLIEDNQSMIDNKLDPDGFDNSGYASLARVKGAGGSFDLTPLFVGAQGTLGIISEMILKAEFYNSEQSVVALAFSSSQDLNDMLDEIRKLEPEYASLFDMELFRVAVSNGKRHAFIANAIADKKKLAGVVLCRFADFSERTRKRKAKKVLKSATKLNASYTQLAETQDDIDELMAIESYVRAAQQSDNKDIVTPALFRGVYIPAERFEDFTNAMHKLSLEHKITLPFSGYINDSIYHFWPQFNLRTVTDKQKMLKLYDAFVAIVVSHGGSAVAEAGEGRLKAPFSNKHNGTELTGLYAKLKAIFDPYGTLNGGVKNATELRSVVSHLRSDVGTITQAPYGQ